MTTPAPLRHPYGAGPDQFGDLRLPAGPGPHPVAMLIHGGWWRNHISLDHLAGLAAALPADGIATWNVEFRRVRGGGGYPQTFDDVTAALAALAELGPAHGLDLGRIVVAGHSAGAHLAAWLASTGAQPRPLGVVAIAGPLDLERTSELHAVERDDLSPVHELLGGSPIEVPDHYALASPSRRLPAGIPVVAVHGTDDDNVPLELSQRYVEAAQAAGDPARLIALAGVDHFAPIDPATAAGETVRRTIAELLLRPATQTGGGGAGS